MIEKLIPIELPAGFMHNGTKYQSKGRWYSGHLVRWHQGALQPVGGWTRLQGGGAGNMAALTGEASAILCHTTSAGLPRVVVGTTTGLFACDPTSSTTVWSNISPASLASNVRWQLEVFGNTVIAYPWGDYEVYTWDMNLANVAVAVVGPPAQVIGGIVTTPERFLFALGTGGNNQQLHWADQESTSVWTPAATNQAGDITLQTPGELLTGRRLRDKTLLFTTHDVWSATYIGGQFVYSFRLEGEACGLRGPQSVAIADSRAFWMSRNGFFMYDGWVRKLDCAVYDKVFGEIVTQGDRDNRVAAWANTAYDEIWWFYPVGDGLTQNNRYVKFNYVTGAWDYGTLGRGAAIDAPPLFVPLAVDSSGVVWRHEEGNDRGSEVPFIESGPFEIEDGDRVLRVQRIVPDEKTLGDTKMTLYTAMDPTSSESASGPFTLTQPTDVRLTGRLMRLYIEQNVETNWRIGTPKLGVIPLGRR